MPEQPIEQFKEVIEQVFPGAQIIEPGTQEYNELVDVTKASLEDDSFKELENRILNWQVLPAQFSCTDSECWEEYVDKNRDSYGRAAVVFAQEWARNMDDMIANSDAKSFSALTSQQIDEASKRADEIAGGITGFMFGAAVHMLSKTWLWGKELQAYHNTKMGQPEAKGTVNPAVVTIG